MNRFPLGMSCAGILVAVCGAISPGSVTAGSLRSLLGETELEASLASVLQAIDRNATDDGHAGARAGYRGDLEATLPLGNSGRGRGRLHGHLRFGQGSGQTHSTHTGALNSLAFAASSSGDAFAILAQLYYQFEYPLDPDPPPGRSRGARHLEVTAGKLDPFVFFDQNAVAGDETTAFLNNVFVHNPLLDSGGDLGADRYGFTKGVRAAWYGDADDDLGIGASIGLFGTGRGADLGGSPRRPLAIAQVEISPRGGDGETAGTFRLYGWSNPQTEDFDGMRARHTGWGASLDLRVASALNLFGRYGRRTRGHGQFDKALTVGFEASGTAWRRTDDAFGVGWGRLATDDLHARAERGAAAGRPARSEQILEVFYRMTVNRYLDVSPGVQGIRRPGGDSTAPGFVVAGVRIRIAA